MEHLTPRQIVAELDRYIIGQDGAKKAVAVALRNRYRRQQIDEKLRGEVTPKNILMIGPTGVGKTEIARQLARVTKSPWIKVEATKFTEVGYVGRDVESIVHDIVDTAVTLVHDERLVEVQEKAELAANARIADYLLQQVTTTGKPRKRRSQAQAVASATGVFAEKSETVAPAPTVTRGVSSASRQRVLDMLDKKLLEDTTIEIEVSPEGEPFDQMISCPVGMTVDELADSMASGVSAFVQAMPRKRLRKVAVKEARRILTKEEAEKLIDFDEVVDEAVKRVEENGVVFIDELDKIIGPRIEAGTDVSGEGVQRDLLPIVEGTTVMTRFGPVRTDHILFIGAGSFYSRKPSELIPEMQGRFPLRVELKSLTKADFVRILVEPANSLVKQYKALLATEGVELDFSQDGLDEIAVTAESLNSKQENIGARRLHTIVEKVLEDVSFTAPERSGEKVVVDREFVRGRVSDIAKDYDLSKYIL